MVMKESTATSLFVEMVTWFGLEPDHGDDLAFGVWGSGFRCQGARCKVP